MFFIAEWIWWITLKIWVPLKIKAPGVGFAAIVVLYSLGSLTFFQKVMCDWNTWEFSL